MSEAGPDISRESTSVEATMLLCDYAQAVNGKLYVVGGGWSILNKLLPRASMSLAVKLSVPWSRANEQLHVEASLITDHGDAVTVHNDDGPEQPIVAGGEIELGRPPGLRHGTPLDAIFALNFEGLDLDAGGYVWVLRVGNEIAARAPFLVIVPNFQLPGMTP